MVLVVDLSARQFYHEKFADHVIFCLKNNHVHGHKLALEVTESLLIDDVDTTISKMQMLGAKGIQFALDDPGTGAAPLSYLKRLLWTQSKIDQSLVCDLLVDQSDKAIGRTIIAVDLSLDLQVVVEGVETHQLAERLKELGCQFCQGYFFGRPQLASALRDKIHSSKTAL